MEKKKPGRKTEYGEPITRSSVCYPVSKESELLKSIAAMKARWKQEYIDSLKEVDING